MDDVFLKLVNLSISASWLILAVLVLRIVLKKAPKWVMPLLWGVVALRLVCLFSIESALSLIPSAETIPSEIVTETREPVLYEQATLDIVTNPTLPSAAEVPVGVSRQQAQVDFNIYSILWLAGMAALLVHALVSAGKLKRKLATAILLRDNIYESEFVDSPFVFGVVKPNIYLPMHMDEGTAAYVIAHEHAHLARRDHWWKVLGYLVLALHWFNPLVWAAFILAGKDMEMSCDEAVIKKMGDCVLVDYTASLLSLATGKHIIAGTPLAFGEGDVKGRIRNLANWKKPAFGIIVVAVVSCAIFAVCLLTNPKQESFRLRIIIPAGSQETVVYADEEISPLGNYITVTADEGLGDTQVSLKPVQVRTETAYDEPAYLTPGMPVKMDAEKSGWFRIGVNVQNNTDEDKIVYVNVDNIEVRIESTILDDIEQYRTDYIGDAPKVSSIAQLLSYPKDFRYSSIELKTQTKPYELIVYLTGNDPVQKKDFDLCAATAFDLIGNMDVITFCKVETGETIASFVRSDFDKVEVYDLDTAINQAILEHFSDENTDGLIHVESHVLLANEAISGTPMVGEDTHIEEETEIL